MLARRCQALVATLAVLPALALASCSDSESGDVGAEAGSGTQTGRAAAVQAETTSSTAATAADPPRLARSRGDARVSTVATRLEVPWDLAFLPNGSALVTERPGRVRLLTRDRRLRREPLERIAVSAEGEGGLLGVAIDPRFDHDNDFVYFYFTTSSGMQVARYRLQGTRLRRDAVVLDGIAAGPIHDSGRIRFGPDGRLHVSTGDAGRPEVAQDRGSPNGKYLRLDPRDYRGDRAGPAEVFSRGHRNAQGLDWQPRTKRLISTEHGPDGDDEVNIVTRGGNYGGRRRAGATTAAFALRCSCTRRASLPRARRSSRSRARAGAAITCLLRWSASSCGVCASTGAASHPAKRSSAGASDGCVPWSRLPTARSTS